MQNKITVTLEDWIQFFPFDAPRPNQILIINDILSKIRTNPDLRFIVLDAPTGIGKSAIALTLARYINANMNFYENSAFNEKAYFLTSQKMLQEQYINDFEMICSIQSKSNYKCHLDTADNCGDGHILKEAFQNADVLTAKEQQCKSNCSYSNALKQFVKAPLSITNYQFFLNASKADKIIQPAKVLVLDECHLLENELWNFIEIELSEKFIKDEFNMKIPYNESPDKLFHWIEFNYLTRIMKQVSHLSDMANKLKMNEEMESYKEVVKQINYYVDYKAKMEYILVDRKARPDNYVVDVVDFTDKRSGEAYKKVLLKPVNIDPYTESVLFQYGRYVILMSATVGDYHYYMKNVGISEKESIGIQADSPFKAENRLIVISDVGSMGMKNIQETLPNMIGMIDTILTEHKNERGVIFCNSYKIANYIQYNYKNKRLMFHSSSDRRDQLETFINMDSGNAVFVAVAMSTGLDLKDDIARFGIICKMPYPYLGDKQVQAKKNFDAEWYPYTTVKELIQNIGRIVRSEDDHGTTYILDSDFWFLYGKNKKYFPKYIQDAIIKLN